MAKSYTLPTATEIAQPSGGVWILAATILASSMAFIDSSALNVAMPAIQQSMDASAGQLLWVINAYLLMLAALILVGGSLGDRYGRKKVFMAGIAIFLAGSLACGLAPSITFLIGARLLQGLGGALMIPGSLAILSAAFPPEQRGKAIGTWSAATTIVTVAGPLLGGLLADAGLWRGVFLINVPLGLAALYLLFTQVPESRDETVSGGMDWLGAALVAVGLAGLTYGFLSAPDLGFSDWRVAGALLIGVAALVAFVLWQARNAHAMLPLGLFRSSKFTGANLLTLFLYGALSVGTFFLSLNLVQVQGYSKSLAGLAFLPFTLILTAMARWAGRLADQHGPRYFLIGGPATVGLGFLALALPGVTAGPAQYWTTFLPGVVLIGVGMGLTVAPLTTTVMNSVATEQAGTASGTNNAVSRLAGVLAIAVVGAVALFAFAGALRARSAVLPLDPPARQALLAEAGKLGEAVPPPGLAADQQAAVKAAIGGSFVDAYRRVELICAGLCWLSALMAGLWIKKEKE